MVDNTFFIYFPVDKLLTADKLMESTLVTLCQKCHFKLAHLALSALAEVELPLAAP